MTLTGLHAGLADQLAQWRAYLADRPGVSAADVAEVETHLLDQVDDLTGRGLSDDEAFLVAVKRLGRQDTLARIVRRGERRTVLRRTADDTDPSERVVVANADQLLIVVALADPPPRTGFVERALIAAYAGGLVPILCLTKTDLAPAEPFAEQFADLDLTITTAGRDDPLDAVAPLLTDKVTVLLGHSGVGKSTLVNRLVPEADRAIGEVSGVGKGRHTSTQSVALPLEGCGWIIDTPGIRSFGLAHIEPDDVLLAFSDLAEAIKDCPRGCGHLGPPADPECALDGMTGPAAGRVAAARRLLVALSTLEP